VKDVPLSELAVDDKVLIKPGEKIPRTGSSLRAIARSMKRCSRGNQPRCQTDGRKSHRRVHQREGALTIEVKGTGKDSFLSQVIDLVKQAQDSKSKTQDLANTAALWLTMVALGAA